MVAEWGMSDVIGQIAVSGGGGGGSGPFMGRSMGEGEDTWGGKVSALASAPTHKSPTHPRTRAPRSKWTSTPRWSAS